MLLDKKKLNKAIFDNKISYKKNDNEYMEILDFVASKINSIDKTFKKINNITYKPMFFPPWVTLDIDRITFTSYQNNNSDFFKNTNNKENNYFKFPSSLC